MRFVRFDGMIGHAAHRRVFMGFAAAKLLWEHSFTDVLNEDTGAGYQRRFDERHSADFRRYIQAPDSTTIPLTLNVRPDSLRACSLRAKGPLASLAVPRNFRALSQVDCQHRLGRVGDLDIELPFMMYLGLTVREEMEIFNTINSKARGLQTSLLDYHEAQLSSDLGSDRPEIFIALVLQSDQRSPWYKQLDLGGTSTSGLKRRASLRTMQKAVKVFLRHSRILQDVSPSEAAAIVLAYWNAVRSVFADEWQHPRKYLISKGVGVYALMRIAADFVTTANIITPDIEYFRYELTKLQGRVDWRTKGAFRGLGGATGVDTAVSILQDIYRHGNVHAVTNG